MRPSGSLFDKDGDRLGLAIIKEVEVLLFQAGNRMILLVVGDHINLDEFGGDANG